MRSIDRWLKWAAVVGPMVSGLIFGGIGYVAGYKQARDAIIQNTQEIVLLKSWKEKQVEFNQQTVISITRLKTLIKDTMP